MLLLLALAGCAGGTSAPAGPDQPESAGALPTPSREPARGLEATLGELADRALAAGKLDVAADRYGRLRTRDPRSVRALVGLGRVAFAQGDAATARARFSEALRVDADAVEARLGMVDLARGDPAEVRGHLERVLEGAPFHQGAHARMAALTGRAPRLADGLPEALLLASRYPYDPKTLVEAGRRLADAGRAGEAIPLFESALLLADLDPEAADAAIALLPTVSEPWRERRVVPVHVYLDAALRSDPGWRFRQRRLWQLLSEALDPLVNARFVVRSLVPFDRAPPGTSLDAWLVGLSRSTGAGRRRGLFAGFTAEPASRRTDAKRGIAEYLGRHLVVRDAPGEEADRVLAHELLHIYGGIHVIDKLDSLMNPSGDSRQVDPLNAAIVRSLAKRRFDPGGIEQNVLNRVDLAAVTEAFSRGLQVNLELRGLGLSQLIGDASSLGPGAMAKAQQITRIDSHLGNVSSFLSRLLWATGQRVESVAVLEVAAKLYGRQTPAGRAAYARAEVLRRRLKAELGVE